MAEAVAEEARVMVLLAAMLGEPVVGASAKRTMSPWEKKRVRESSGAYQLLSGSQLVLPVALVQVMSLLAGRGMPRMFIQS